MLNSAPIRNPKACNIQQGTVVRYRRDGKSMFAFPISKVEPMTMRFVGNQDQNWVADNMWNGVISGARGHSSACSTLPSGLPVGSVDPLTGEEVQATYQMQNYNPRFVNGHREVKSTNVSTCGKIGPTYLEKKFGVFTGLIQPSSLYSNLR